MAASDERRDVELQGCLKNKNLRLKTLSLLLPYHGKRQFLVLGAYLQRVCLNIPPSVLLGLTVTSDAPVRLSQSVINSLQDSPEVSLLSHPLPPC